MIVLKIDMKKMEIVIHVSVEKSVKNLVGSKLKKVLAKLLL